MWTIKQANVLNTVGDVNQIEYGGGFLLDDGESQWIEYYEGLEDEDEDIAVATVYRADVPDHVWDTYDWAGRKLKEMAVILGLDVKELRELGHSKSVIDRALAVEFIAAVYGWYELDQYPLTMNVPELRKRWEL